jgi:hypothetical protein
VHCFSSELRKFPETITRTNKLLYNPEPPEIIDESVAVYPILALVATCTAVSCLSLSETRLLTGTIDGTPYPVYTVTGTFAYEYDNLYLTYMFPTQLTLTNPSHTAELVYISWMTLIITLGLANHKPHCRLFWLIYIVRNP